MKKIFLLFFAFLFLNCTNNNNPIDGMNNKRIDCNLVDIVCTREFVILNVSIKNQNNENVILDAYVIERTDTNEMLTKPDINTVNSYPFIDDSYLEQINFDNWNLLFKGYINNREVVREKFVVSSDCCHIYLVSGNLNLTLNI